ncbi:MAG TPA: ABC transporter permease [Egibacteraceae bacterium]|nr:ABC transporter permease [Egibacteraceae bacterium]
MSALAQWLSDPASWWGPGGLLARTLEHAGYSLGTTLAAVAVTLPVALWVGHTGRGRLAAVQLANIGRAVPTFGILLGAFVAFGYGLAPVYAALVALAIPPIMVNTVVGVGQVDPEVREAAEGMGMRGWQVLLRVELPLAAPMVMAGVRTAAVQVVATATLAAVVGLGGLGRPIVDGLAQGAAYSPRAQAMVVTGAIAVALLALAAELGLSAVERALTPPGG